MHPLRAWAGSGHSCLAPHAPRWLRFTEEVTRPGVTSSVKPSQVTAASRRPLCWAPLPPAPRTPLLQGSECNRRPEPRPLLTLPPSVRAQCRANFPGSQGPAPGCIPGPCVQEAFCE